jgi:CheY-like chemotaxis protein
MIWSTSMRKGDAEVTLELDTYADDFVNLVSSELSTGLRRQLATPATVGYEITPLRVVIADDVPMIRSFLRVVLAGCGDYNVVGMAADGTQAVRLAAALQPDVVLLDMLMPRTHETDVLSGIRGVVPNARIVIVSGIDPALEAPLLEAGATGFVSKQVRPLDFLDRLKAVLDRSPADRDVDIDGNAVR